MQGMRYNDVYQRLKRISKGLPSEAKGNLIKSLLNQAERNSPGSGQELMREVGQASHVGSGSTQKGWGTGKKLGAGKYTYNKGVWIKV